ncbi:MAG: DUF4886 domain-containing protein, partial [Bacteroidaceae bacterium]|nr:DUF4886 domain-containing protein [Bacteroidaceae bacterium]
LCALPPLSAKVIRVLAIGNSFSEDATAQYLYELGAAQGDSLIIGNAYIGGCTIDRHLDNLRNTKYDYQYQKTTGDGRTIEHQTELRRIILDEPWDYITLQQASQLSGVAESYANLPALRRAVLLLATNPDVEFLWHMTWAYAKTFRDKRFEAYDYDQQKMYAAILGCVRTEVPKALIKRVIPSGTAIQLARYRMGDVLNRDGFHLSYTLGRYTAACTWCEMLTGRIIDGNSYYPETITKEEAQVCQQSAHEAIFMQQTAPYMLF